MLLWGKLEIRLSCENKSGGHKVLSLRRMEKLESISAKEDSKKYWYRTIGRGT